MEGWTSSRGVSQTPDLTRVLNLPRRDWQTYGEEAAVLLTERLKTPEGTMKLKPVQAVSLIEMYDQRGLLGGQRVGAGKTLTSLLAATILGSKRPLLLVPASLRDKTHFDRAELAEHWRIHPGLQIRGYAELSLERNKNLLTDMAPDLIVADEGHRLKHLPAGRTKRVNRYLEAHQDTAVVILSGTITTKSLMDYWHLALWALREGAPLPLDHKMALEWAAAIDAKVRPGERLSPGALEKLGSPVREGFQNRLTATPGVVNTDAAYLGNSLQISPFDFDVPEQVDADLLNLDKTWAMPSGLELMEPLEMWRARRQLSMGFYYEWSPRPPEEWLEARKVWAAYVRNRLARNRKGLDTELQVRMECSDLATGGEIVQEWFDWVKVKNTFTPTVVTRWRDTSLLRAATGWLRAPSAGHGIVWVEHVEIGVRLSAASGIRYFGGGAAASRDILTHQGPMICSIAAHGEGKNLQRYHRNLVLTPPATGKTWEQLMGRTHREGQQADTVYVEVLRHTQPFKQALRDAIEDAHYIEDTQGSPQRLCYGDFTFKP